MSKFRHLKLYKNCSKNINFNFTEAPWMLHSQTRFSGFALTQGCALKWDRHSMDASFRSSAKMECHSNNKWSELLFHLSYVFASCFCVSICRALSNQCSLNKVSIFLPFKKKKDAFKFQYLFVYWKNYQEYVFFFYFINDSNYIHLQNYQYTLFKVVL